MVNVFAFLLVIPALLSTLLLAAHFFRAENVPGMIASLLILPILIIPRPWARRTAQILLVIGALEWIRATIQFVQIRQAMGAPAGRLMIILGAVAAFTVLSAALLWARPARRRFGE